MQIRGQHAGKLARQARRHPCDEFFEVLHVGGRSPIDVPLGQVERVRIDRRRRLADGVAEQQPCRRHVALLGLLDEHAGHRLDVMLRHGLAQGPPQLRHPSRKRIARPTRVAADEPPARVAHANRLRRRLGIGAAGAAVGVGRRRGSARLPFRTAALPPRYTVGRTIDRCVRHAVRGCPDHRCCLFEWGLDCRGRAGASRATAGCCGLQLAITMRLMGSPISRYFAIFPGFFHRPLECQIATYDDRTGQDGTPGTLITAKPL